MEQIGEVFQWIMEVLSFRIFNIGNYPLTVGAVVLAIIVFLATKYFSIAISRFILKPFFRRTEVDVGRSYAISQIVVYIIYVTGIFTAFSLLGIQLSVLWAGAAALLVGVGLGLQQTFNDFFSGLLLLLEGPVEVGNVIEVDGFIGRVIEIGLRTSKVRSRDDIMIIVPNSHLVNHNIINWTTNQSPLRFSIDVGVAYGSDVDLVSRVLVKAAEEHPGVLDRPVPRIMFKNFGDSSLDFKLLFYSEEPWRIEFVKSDLRFTVYRLFAAHNIQIPFPQQDVWLRSPESTSTAEEKS
ncbi:MAG: mechanosensitive ion channel family protein [Saprospiraceae bacterium]